MKDHVPDLERCKRLQEKGFPQEGLFYHLEDPEWVSIKSWSIAGPNTKPYRAPIVTELVGEIGEVQVGAIEIAYRMRCHSEDWMWNVSICYLPESSTNADTLPNALADLWIWLRERGE